jgi:hypothetical protein
MSDKEHVKTLLAGFSNEDLKTALIEGANKLPDQDKKEVAAQIQSGMAPPDDQTRNWLWLVVISAFAVVLVGSFVTLAIAVFRTQNSNTVNLVKPELVLSMFTSVVGFLAGLFVPSPVANKPK